MSINNEPNFARRVLSYKSFHASSSASFNHVSAKDSSDHKAVSGITFFIVL